MTAGAARSALELCRPEGDETISLDYLSPKIVGPGGLVDGDSVIMAYTFVDECLAAAQKRHNLDLIGKYEPARRYFEAKVGPLKRRLYAPSRRPIRWGPERALMGRGLKPKAASLAG